MASGYGIGKVFCTSMIEIDNTKLLIYSKCILIVFYVSYQDDGTSPDWPTMTIFTEMYLEYKSILGTGYSRHCLF